MKRKWEKTKILKEEEEEEEADSNVDGDVPLSMRSFDEECKDGVRKQ